MGYMARPDRVARRHDLNVILPGVQSLVVVALEYGTRHSGSGAERSPARAYSTTPGARTIDLMTPRLEALASRSAAGGDDVASRVYVDTGAVWDAATRSRRAWASSARIQCSSTPARRTASGSCCSTCADAYDAPHRPTMCGTCTRCLGACPTGALPEPYTLDARLCISYLTIELKGSIPVDLRPLMGNWVYGCDICQEACPFTRFVQPTAERAFYPAEIDRARRRCRTCWRSTTTASARGLRGRPSCGLSGSGWCGTRASRRGIAGCRSSPRRLTGWLPPTRRRWCKSTPPGRWSVWRARDPSQKSGLQRLQYLSKTSAPDVLGRALKHKEENIGATLRC